MAQSHALRRLNEQLWPTNLRQPTNITMYSVAGNG